MSRASWLALLISLVGIWAAWMVGKNVFEEIPHIEDEMAYVWQTKVIARGHLTVPEPEHRASFLVPFVVDHNGQRFGKYPLGWPVVLAIGVFLGARSLVNPLLAGFGVWLVYRLGQRIFSTPVGLLAAALTVTSPFFLMNSGSLLSHPLGLVLSAAFMLAWLNAWDPLLGEDGSQRWLAAITAALAIGVLALTRPLSALALAAPFAPQGIYLLLRGDRSIRLRLVVFGILAAAVASLLFAWQFAVTGDPFLNPYTLWWDYDRVGFGPGHGLIEGGHTLSQAWINTQFSLKVGASDLLGWGKHSWIFLPFGLASVLWRRSWGRLQLAGVALSFVAVYLAYWIGSWLFGPRYYYEALFSLMILTAAGIAFLAGWPLQEGEPWRSFPGWGRVRPLLTTAVVAFLVALNALFYLPQRMITMYGLYGIRAAQLQPFLSPEAQKFVPALVIVYENKWTEYGVFLDLSSPFMDSDFLFVINISPTANRRVAESFPDRMTIYYSPDEPGHFSLSPPPGE
jgi:hypothetical protein